MYFDDCLQHEYGTLVFASSSLRRIRKSMMKHRNQNREQIENHTSLDLVIIIEKCMFVDSETEYIGLPNCVHYRV